MSHTSDTLAACETLVNRLYRRFVLGKERGAAHCTRGELARERAARRGGPRSALRQLSDEELILKLARASSCDALIAALGCSRSGFYHRLAKARGGKKTNA